MSGFKFKLNKDKLTKQLEEKESSGKNDKRFLNYYDLKAGETMRVRLLPSENGDLFVEWGSHGPNMQKRNIKPIQCLYSALGEDCPVCAVGFEYKDNGDDTMAKKFFRKNYTLAQCIVIDSKIEVNEGEDGNPVKLFHMPWGVRDMLTEAMATGEIEDPTSVDLIIKKKIKKGGSANYDLSHFADEESELPNWFLEMYEDGVAKLFDLEKEKHDVLSLSDTQKWLDDAVSKMEGRTSETNSNSSDDDDGDVSERRSSRGVKSDDTDNEVSELKSSRNKSEESDDGAVDNTDDGERPMSLVEKYKNRRRA